MQEEWKVFKDTRSNSIKNTRGVLWQVSNYGNIKKNGVPYECRLHKKGYKVFGPGWGVHRAVAMIFIPNPNNYNEVDHINGNPLDNRATNLRWCNHKQNMNNPITLKRMSKSQKINQNKLETKKKMSESHQNKYRVYHDDGTYHYEKY